MPNVQACLLCRLYKPELKTYKYSGQQDEVDYIHLCSQCVKRFKDTDLVEYNPTKLETYVEDLKSKTISPTILYTDDGKQFLSFRNGHGLLINKSDILFIVQELSKTIEVEGLVEFVENENIHKRLRDLFEQDPNDSNKYIIPMDRLRLKRKQFDPDKSWGCTCGNCSNKMSSKDGGEYFSISPAHLIEGPWERACSEGCAKVIAKDIVMNWVNANKYEAYFDLEAFDHQLTILIKET